MKLSTNRVLIALRESANRGDLLERVTHATLVHLGFENVERQLSGTQYGFDISARIRNSEGDQELWKIECKNLRRPVGLQDLSPKLIWHLHPSVIDHYVLVATSPLANDLRHVLENNPLPFPVTVWSEEVLANFVLASPTALALLGFDGSESLSVGALPPPPVFPPMGNLRFDVLHQHNPPRQFAYFVDQNRTLKAFTDLELKLDLLFTNRSATETLVTDIVCRTLRYRRLTHERIVVQTKAKGLFSPEIVRFLPSRVSGGEVSVLDGKALIAKPRGVEMLRSELVEGVDAGYYELQFAAHVAGESRSCVSPVVPLVVLGERDNTCSLMVVGRHYDSPVERLLDLPQDSWNRVVSSLPEGTVRLFGPSMYEIIHGTPPLERWQVRELDHIRGPDGTWTIPDVTPREVLTLDGLVDEPVYTLDDCRTRAEGNSEWPRILERQFGRRGRLLTKGESM